MSHYTEAYTAGRNAALAIKIGDVFMGAIPEAIKLYPAGSAEWRVFLSGYLDFLPSPVTTDQAGKVVKLG